MSDGQIQSLHYGTAICKGLTRHSNRVLEMYLCRFEHANPETTTKGINTRQVKPPAKQESNNRSSLPT